LNRGRKGFVQEAGVKWRAAPDVHDDLEPRRRNQMFEDLFRGWTPLILLAVVVLLFGATRLPALARSIGQSRNAFKSEMKKGEQEGAPDAAATPDATKSDSTATTPESTGSKPQS
jgi:sec-independent protein translocase protein TatA